MLDLERIRQDVEDVDGADADVVEMLSEHVQTLTNEVERLRDELSRAAGLAMALMAHVPDDLLVGNLRPRALAFCREWGELQGHVDGVRAAVLAEREACAAICDARSRMHNASGIVHTHSDQVRYLEARRIAELIRERS